jgi:hypothetical protein
MIKIQNPMPIFLFTFSLLCLQVYHSIIIYPFHLPSFLSPKSAAVGGLVPAPPVYVAPDYGTGALDDVCVDVGTGASWVGISSSEVR